MIEETCTASVSVTALISVRSDGSRHVAVCPLLDLVEVGETRYEAIAKISAAISDRVDRAREIADAMKEGR